jgi:hypothetical protein
VYVFICFETRLLDVPHAGLELTILLPHLPSAGITGIYHHAQLSVKFLLHARSVVLHVD